MPATLEVVCPGTMSTLQDLGRRGLRRLGVPLSGALDPGWLRIANVLVGNPETTAAIEFFAGGLVLHALDLPLRVALAGYFRAEVEAASGDRRRIDAWRSVRLSPGEILRCGPLDSGRVGYVALGGVTVARQLGSASTYPPAKLGGVDGQALVAGTRLLLDDDDGSGETQVAMPPLATAEAIRVVLGPQDDHFDRSAVANLLNESYTVSAATDRMGMRLLGSLLRHRTTQDAEIVSDATLPGSIQVPGDGQPIVLLADGQTVGGYPKIATVISADLPRLALQRPGSGVRFQAVTVAAGEHAARQREARLRSVIASIQPLRSAGTVDPEAIFSASLISGVVDALAVATCNDTVEQVRK